MHSIYTASCLKTIFNNFYEKGRKSEYSQSKDMPKSKEARLLWMFCVFCPAIAAQLQQCLPNKCSEETNQQNTFARGSEIQTACEPRNSLKDIAQLATISVSPENATCDTSDKFCSLMVFSRCDTCNRARSDMSHLPSHMIDDIKWTWWQTKDLNPSQYAVNITLNLPKVFILTDDILLEFNDGKPKEGVVEKSSDYGKTWTALQYFADNCLERFGIKPTKNSDVLSSIEDAFSSICVEDYSINVMWEYDNQVVPVFISRRLISLETIRGINKQKICVAMSNNTYGLKSFLEITNLRIRLLHPAILRMTNSFETVKRSSHYGIKKVQINGRCQCNGHASECIIEGKTATCLCQHNTQGRECERCRPLYWNTKWKSGAYSPTNRKGRANPCVSYYTKDYWETFLSNKTPRFRNPSGSPSFDPPKPCQCNKHSNRCEHIPTYDFLMCVDCRHHTQGQNCHRCDRRYFKDPTKSLDDPEVCQACRCSRPGSISYWCRKMGQCICRPGYTGRKCNICSDDHYRWGKTCKKITKACTDAFARQQGEGRDMRRWLSRPWSEWCACYESARCKLLTPEQTTQPSNQRIQGSRNGSDRLRLDFLSMLIFLRLTVSFS